MRHGRHVSWTVPRLFLAPLFLALGVTLAGACSSTAPPSALEETHTRTWTNGGFTTGAAGAVPPAPWVLTEFLNPDPTGVTIQTPQTYAGLNLEPMGGACFTSANCAAGEAGTCQGGVCKPTARTIILHGTNVADATIGGGLRYCRYGNACALVNQTGSLTNINQLSQTMTVSAGDVSADGQIHVRLTVAPVLEAPGHPPNEQPYFYIQLINRTRGNAVLYSDYNFSNQTGVPWTTVMAGGNAYVYTDWQLIDIVPGTPAINVGDSVELDLVAAGCSLGGHMGELYVDGVGSALQGIAISGTAPAQANAGTNLTYNLTYTNGSGAAETGVVIDFTTPPGTTFESFTPPAGATCTAPAVGAAGTIVCTFSGAVAAGATGGLTVTVAIAAGTTGTLVCGNYQISSTQETALLGNKISTTIGCTADSQCATGNWCDESANACKPTLANGTAVPTDAPHMNPTLNGVCTAAAGALVCISGVCDMTDNKCGFANGDGMCTVANEAMVCRSLVCDKDGKCGFANGDGPCTVMNETTVCRSGVCSTSGLCIAAGTCDVDTDCTGGKWCLESTHTCTAKEANGSAIPTDAPHMGPTLNGTCTTAAGALVCVSGVCDTADNKCGYANGDGMCTVANETTVCRSLVCDKDGKCGYANGDGPCTGATGTTVCRSTKCSSADLCEPIGGCDVDADCTGGNWCDETTHTCTAPLANGATLPTDAPHMNPTLNGMCTAAAGALVCKSKVCDAKDSECGYANGDGPCTVMTGPTLCQSGTCSATGVCEAAGSCNVDADCASGNWCNETAHQCTPQLASGAPIPTDMPHTGPVLSGMCTAAAATLVCKAGVCDTKDSECGYANGDGPCTTMNGGLVCQSGACSMTASVCVPMGGCQLDTDCTTATQFCDTSTSMCVPKVANGQAVPTITGHTPPLTGTCSAAVGTAVCVSGVCDMNDNECGYANGDGPCTAMNGTTVCQSGTCSSTGVCEPMGGCEVDADCPAGNWCNEAAMQCTPTLANGSPIPTDTNHMNPTLDGVCSAAAGALVCTSGVCDPKDNECGYANGDGPCVVASGGGADGGVADGSVAEGGGAVDGGAVVSAECRSTICATTGPDQGLCVACTESSQCAGATPICDTTTNACVQCQTSTDCPTTGQPVCDTPSSSCVACNGDFGSTTTDPCSSMNAPFCFLAGAATGTCGKCSMNSDCTGHMGDICDTTSGLCTSACTSDSQCLTSQWCDAPTGGSGMCEAKIANGKPLPTTPSNVATCTNAVGARVCISGVCDANDNECGYATGDGPCASNMQCITGGCDKTTSKCMTPDAGSACTTDPQCGANNYCNSGKCAPTLPTGATCQRSAMCQSAECYGNVCSTVVSSGSGVFCSVRAVGGGGAGTSGDAPDRSLALFGLAAIVGAARRRKRRA